MDRVQRTWATAVIAEAEATAEVNMQFDDPHAPWLNELVTPHPGTSGKSSEQKSTPLISAINFEHIADRLHAAEQYGNDRYDEERVRVAHELAGTVRRTLHFTRGEEIDEDTPLVMPSLDQIRYGQKANCYGFAVLTSLLLERANIEHALGFLNGHAIILLFTGEGKKTSAWMVDPTSSAFTMDMAKLSPSSNLADAKRQMQADGHAVVNVSTLGIASGIGRDMSALWEKHAWLLRGQREGEQMTWEEILRVRSQLTLTVLPQHVGRKVLQEYANYHIATVSQDSYGALEALAEMPIYPEQDPGAPEHARITELIKDLVEDAEYDTTLLFRLAKATRTYIASFGPNPPKNVASLKKFYGRLVGHLAQLSTQQAR